jgi:hypothetical protein
MIGMEARLAPDGAFEPGGDVMGFSKVGILSA